MRLYIITRSDLEPGYQAAQAVHAAIQFQIEHPEIQRDWFEKSNTVALLAISDETKLTALMRKAESIGVRVAAFREPDLGNQLTSIALEPTDYARRLCSGLPLTLGA
jgi:peptidyl-tRNA hydrolase